VVVLVGSKLESLISKEIDRLGFAFLGLEIENSPNNRKLLRVYVNVINNLDTTNEQINLDMKKPGVTLDDCSKINYHLNKLLSVNADLNFSNYTLEISSPGVERRLFNLLQIKEQIGKEVKIKLISSLENRNNFTGRLLDVDLALKKVFLEVEEQNFCFNYDNIAKANLVYRKL
jgi:ribosome maturation factor RimP